MNDSRELFNQLMQVGDVGQDRVIAHYRAQGYTLLGLNNDIRYDIEMRSPTGERVLIEVKTDTTTSRNLAIETWSRNKPSGIYATEAHRYCIFFSQSGELWDFCSATLKRELTDLMALRLVPVKAIEGTGTWVKLLPMTLAKKLGLAEPVQLSPATQVTGISVLNTAPPGTRAHGFFG